MKNHSFNTFPAISGPWAQTVFSKYFPVKDIPGEAKSHIINLDDGDQLMLIENTPKNWDGKKSIVLVHGLAGDYKSFYIMRMGNIFYSKGYNVIRMNHRGAGPGIDLAMGVGHGGRSYDLLKSCQWLEEKYPNCAYGVVGYSLGANLTIKMLGEFSELLGDQLKIASAVSFPLSLEDSCNHLKKSKMFEKYFLICLDKIVKQRHEIFPALKDFPIPSNVKTLYEFDDLYTGPISGYKSAKHYYDSNSCLQFMGSIKKPLLLLTSLDDPIVDSFNLNKMPKKENFELYTSNRGGHVGFLGHQRLKPHFWIDSIISEKFDKVIN